MEKPKFQTNVCYNNIDDILDYAIKYTNDIDTNTLLRIAIAAIIDKLDYKEIPEDQIVYIELRDPNSPYTNIELVQLMTRIALRENPLIDPEVIYCINAKCIQLYRDIDFDHVNSIIIYDNTNDKIMYSMVTDLYYDIRKDIIIIKFKALGKNDHIIDDMSIKQLNDEVNTYLKTKLNYEKNIMNILKNELTSDTALSAIYHASLNSPYDKLSLYIYTDIEPSSLRDVYCKMLDNAMVVISLYGRDGRKTKCFIASVVSTTRTTVCVEFKYAHNT